MTIEMLKDVWKTCSGREFVLKGINLEIKEGDFVLIKGRSGAGKTTLLKIAGLQEKPSKGSVEVFGREASGLNDSFLIPHMTILGDIEIPMYLKGTRGELEVRS